MLLVHGGPVCPYSAMYIESVPNRNSPPAILLRESYRQDGKSVNGPSATYPTGPKPISKACAAC